MNNKITAATAECVLLMAVLQALRIGAERALALGFPELSKKMLTMCAMLALTLLFAVYIRLRRVSVPVLPKRFSAPYVTASAVAAVLFISAPSNYTVGVPAVLELIYGSFVTPVFEETVFRGYMWERTRSVCESDKAVYLLTAMLFAVWHIGYMLPQLYSGNWFAVLTKLAAGLVYGLIVGFVRLKCKNLYLPIVVHGVMNLFMI